VHGWILIGSLHRCWPCSARRGATEEVKSCEVHWLPLKPILPGMTCYQWPDHSRLYHWPNLDGYTTYRTRTGATGKHCSYSSRQANCIFSQKIDPFRSFLSATRIHCLVPGWLAPPLVSASLVAPADSLVSLWFCSSRCFCSKWHSWVTQGGAALNGCQASINERPSKLHERTPPFNPDKEPPEGSAPVIMAPCMLLRQVRCAGVVWSPRREKGTPQV